MSDFIPQPDDSMTILGPTGPTPSQIISHLEDLFSGELSDVESIISSDAEIVISSVDQELERGLSFFAKIEKFLENRGKDINDFIDYIIKYGKDIYNNVRKLNLLPSIKTDIDQAKQIIITDINMLEDEIQHPPIWWLFDLKSFDDYIQSKTTLPTDILNFKPSLKNITVLFNSVKLIIGEFLELITNKIINFLETAGTETINVEKSIMLADPASNLTITNTNTYNLVYYLKKIIPTFVYDVKFFNAVVKFFINTSNKILEPILNFFKKFISFLNPGLFSNITSFFSFSLLTTALSPTGIGEAIFFYGGLFIFITSLIHSFVILKKVFQPQIDYIFNFIRDTTKPINDNMKSDFNIICQNMYNTFINMSFI
jgi:hypothetical protein